MLTQRNASYQSIELAKKIDIKPMNQTLNRNDLMDRCSVSSTLFSIASLLIILVSGAFADEVNGAGLETEFLNLKAEVSDAGHIALSWKLGSREKTSDSIFELQQSEENISKIFRTIYQGRDTASFRSGLADGVYRFRVRAKSSSNTPWGPWSETKTLHVKHHNTGTVLFFLSTGAIVFITTLLLILLGTRQDKSGGTSK
jgi:hypothetical protein